MIRRCVASLTALMSLAAIGLAPSSAQAQARLPERAVRRDIPLTDMIRRAFDAGTRDSTGRPGKNYWQLWMDYTIDAKLYPSTSMVVGRETAVIHNNSPVPMTSVQLRLDQNLFAANVPRAETVPEITDGMEVLSMSFNGQAVDLSGRSGRGGGRGGGGGGRGGRGGADSTAGPQMPSAAGITQTTARINLPTPIPPKGTGTIEVAWTFRVPRVDNMRGVRMGRWGDSLYQVAQWYPRVAVFDDLRQGGWDTDPYLGPSEFYNNFGRYDVRIEVPAGWIVGATGVLQNPEQVLTPTARERLSHVLESDEQRTIVGADEQGPGKSTLAGNRLTWHFVADTTGDVAWAASSQFVWDATRATIPGKGPIPVNIMYLPGNAGGRGGAAAGAAAGLSVVVGAAGGRGRGAAGDTSAAGRGRGGARGGAPGAGVTLALQVPAGGGGGGGGGGRGGSQCIGTPAPGAGGGGGGRGGGYSTGGTTVRHALEFYSKLWMPYAFPQITVVDGPENGMEYPMFIMSSIGASDHETGHEWWPMMVGVNETWYGFMDEGFNQYMNRLSGCDRQGLQPNLDGQGQSYGNSSGNEREAPLMWDANFGGPNYQFQAYQKAPLMLSMLGGVVGDTAVWRAMSDYAKTWRFKHPSPWDYAFFMNNALKQDLSWFWYYWMFTTDAVNGSIQSATINGGRATVVVRQDGQMPSPVVLRVQFAPTGSAIGSMPNSRKVDSATVDVTYPVSVWFAGSRTFTANLSLGGRKIEKITLDPGRRFPDRDVNDNVWPRDPNAVPAGGRGGRGRGGE